MRRASASWSSRMMMRHAESSAGALADQFAGPGGETQL